MVIDGVPMILQKIKSEQSKNVEAKEKTMPQTIREAFGKVK